MTAPLKLVLFDVDGTLVDSQNTIVAAMTTGFTALDMAVPDRAAILSIVGLSLDHAMRRLVPGASETQVAALVAAYKSAFQAARAQARDHAPLYPQVAEVLNDLAARDDLVMGVATGKSRRGLDILLDAHDLHGHFVTRQTADDHPSKPHPSMVLTAMAEAGVTAADTVMIGDTSFDMDMARAAGATAIGVSWGYHSAQNLGAAHLLDGFGDLPDLLSRIWGIPA